MYIDKYHSTDAIESHSQVQHWLVCSKSAKWTTRPRLQNATMKTDRKGMLGNTSKRYKLTLSKYVSAPVAKIGITKSWKAAQSSSLLSSFLLRNKRIAKIQNFITCDGKGLKKDILGNEKHFQHRSSQPSLAVRFSRN